MLDKSICDCNQSTRNLLRDEGILDYDDLRAGERHKFKATLQVRKNNIPLTSCITEECTVSCYRANGRGDARIWITKVKQYAEAGDVLEIKAVYDDCIQQGWVYVRLRSAEA